MAAKPVGAQFIAPGRKTTAESQGVMNHAPTNGMNGKRKHKTTVLNNPVGADLCVCPVNEGRKIKQGEHTGSPLQKDLPEGWVWKTLGEIAEILDSQRVPVNAKEREDRQGNVPSYGATGQVGWIDEYLFDEELILLGEDGAPFHDSAKQKAYIIRGKSWVNNHAHVLRARNGLPNSYIKHYLDIVDYHNFVTGTTRLKLNQSAMRQIPIPLAQQKLIVAEIEKQFSRLDEAVAGLKRIKANLKRYKAAVLKAAVEGKLTEEWRSRRGAIHCAHEKDRGDNQGVMNHAPTKDADAETGAELLKRILAERKKKWEEKNPDKKYKEPVAPDTSNLSELPKEWEWARLDAIAVIKGGITVDSKRKDQTARLVPYLRVANVQRGYIDLREIKEIEAPQKDIEELRLLPGDILFNEGGDRDKLGRGWIWQGQLSECIHQNHVFRARLFVDEVSSKLISWWGNSFGKEYFLREGKQTTNLASINLTKLSEFPVPLPPIAEQHQIAAEVERLLSVTEETEALADANLKRAERLRQGILKKAFSGGLVS